VTHIAFATEIRQNLTSFIPSVLIGKPTRGFGEEEKTDKEDDGWDHLNPPWQTEGSSSVDVTAAVLNVIFWW
jgi:hypothetical protein